MRPDTFVCFKWKPHAGYRSNYPRNVVVVLRNQIQRHWPFPHRFVCVTDDPDGLRRDGIETFPLWTDFSQIPSPHGPRNPSCYRRLKVFSPDAREWFGERFAVLDLDTVIVRDVTSVFDRPEDFVIWGETNPKSYYNGSMFMMTAGARRQVLDTFDPVKSPAAARASGNFGSDQGWISKCLGPGEATWRTSDGVYSYNVHIRPTGGVLPEDARVVHFHGHTDPWSNAGQSIPWVRRHWR